MCSVSAPGVGVGRQLRKGARLPPAKLHPRSFPPVLENVHKLAMKTRTKSCYIQLQHFGIEEGPGRIGRWIPTSWSGWGRLGLGGPAAGQLQT